MSPSGTFVCSINSGASALSPAAASARKMAASAANTAAPLRGDVILFSSHSGSRVQTHQPSIEPFRNSRESLFRQQNDGGHRWSSFQLRDGAHDERVPD